MDKAERYPGEYDHPEVAGPMRAILELCKKHGVLFGATVTLSPLQSGWRRVACSLALSSWSLSMLAPDRWVVATYHKLGEG